MNDEALNTPRLQPTSLGAKMLNLFVSPRAVFDEVVTSPSKAGNWLGPTLLVCLSSLLALEMTRSPERTGAVIESLLNAGSITQVQATALSAHWQMVSRVEICVVVFTGTFW